MNIYIYIYIERERDIGTCIMFIDTRAFVFSPSGARAEGPGGGRQRGQGEAAVQGSAIRQNCEWLIQIFKHTLFDGHYFMDNRGKSRANACAKTRLLGSCCSRQRGPRRC